MISLLYFTLNPLEPLAWNLLLCSNIGTPFSGVVLAPEREGFVEEVGGACLVQEG